MKGVFDVSGVSRYDDEVTERYHFPSFYLDDAKELVGNWVLYRATRAGGGRMSYFAAAFVYRIDPDPIDPTHHYARVCEYLPFDKPVPYRDRGGRFAERFLRELPQPRDSGRKLQRKSVRILEEADFADIVMRGLADTLDPANRVRLELDAAHLDSQTARLLNEGVAERRVEQFLVNRKIRDASFRNRVLEAYQDTCAVTRMKIINGGGRAEAQAAHIWAVKDGGPDVVTNGLALSATAHWLFDRHMISLDDNLCLLVSHNNVPAEFRQLFPQSGEPIHLPKDSILYPRREYVARHRERFAGGVG